MNLLNLFDILDTVSAEKKAETPAGIPPAVQVSQADGQPATIVVPVATTDEVEVLEDEHEDSLELGDEVIITGNVQFRGKTGRIVDFGANKHFVVVDLYNFGKHSFHSSNVEANDYADSEEEDADWRERDHGLFGDDERDEDLNEGFGAYYYEQLAQKVFDLNPNLSTEGRCEELLKAAFPIAVQDLGKKGAQWKFNYDEDFPSDFVSAYAYLQGDGELEEGWKQNLAALGTAAALGATGVAAMGGNTPTTSGPEIVNPNQVVQMIKSGKISNSQDLQSVLAKAKNKNQVWLMLQTAADMQGSSDADAVVQTIAGVREGVAEDLSTMAGAAALGSAAAYGIGHLAGKMINKFDQKYDGTSRTTAKKHKDSCACEKCRGSDNSDLKKGVAEGFLGDREYNRVMPFVKRIASEVSDYDRDEFGEELWSLLDQKYGPKFAQSVLDDIDFYWDTYTELTDQQGVAEGEYDDPRWEPREPDMSRKVDWDIEAERNKPEEAEPAKTVTVRDNNGKVVLTFPSTGGFYGDLRYATSKGFDTDSGDYHLSWKRDTNEGNNWLDTPVSEEFDRIKKLAGLK